MKCEKNAHLVQVSIQLERLLSGRTIKAELIFQVDSLNLQLTSMKN